MIVKSREASSFPVFFPWRYRFCVRGDEVSTLKYYVVTDDAAGVIESAAVSEIDESENGIKSELS